MITRLLVIAFLVGALWSSMSAAYCVASGDSQALISAITDAQQAWVPVDIKIEQGTYVRHGDINGDYDVDVRILGGYLPTPAHTCDESQRTSDATKTQILRSGGVTLRSDHKLEIENLTLGSQFFEGGSGIFIGGDSYDNVVLTNVRVTNVQSSSFVVIGGNAATTGDLKLTNVQFDNMHKATGTCAVLLVMGGVSDATLNHATVDMSHGDFCVRSGYESGRKHVVMWNSILWDWMDPATGGAVRAVHDLSDEGLSFYLYDVDFRDFHVSPADSITFDSRYPSVQVDPFWTNPAAGDFSIANSPVANAGTVDSPGGEPRTDLVGADRGIGSAPDMGAYESPFDDIAGGSTFAVTNTNDVTDANSPLYQGSLRAAMDKAFSLNSPSRIEFFLPACPRVITLNSPLPLVWEPLTLNGYTSAGSSVNSDASGLFNANLCVAIVPATTATTPSALVVPSGAHDAALTVKGVGFGGFSDAIELWGGHSHQIVGNQFGGLMNGVQLFGFGLSAVHIETSGSVIVGGPNPPDRNVFQNANGWTSDDSAAVLMGIFANNAQPACQIIGNLFGITPDGFSAVPNNEYGILLEGSGCLVQGNRMAGNTKDAIYILGGSNHVIQNNVIGPATFFGQDYSNPGAGIRIGAGAANNTIGAPSGFGGTYYQNVITDMDLGGILLGGDGDGNSIRGNFITGNGVLTGLNVDLGLDGPTGNDPGDADTGANDLQNFPVPHGFRWSSGTPAAGTFNIPAEIGASLETAPGHYQIDAYYDHACSPTGRGGGGWFGGAEIDVPSASPVAIQIPVVVPDYDSIHGRITLAATRIDPAGGSTSEFSACMPVDAIFSDAFEK